MKVMEDRGVIVKKIMAKFFWLCFCWQAVAPELAVGAN